MYLLRLLSRRRRLSNPNPESPSPDSSEHKSVWYDLLTAEDFPARSRSRSQQRQQPSLATEPFGVSRSLEEAIRKGPLLFPPPRFCKLVLISATSSHPKKLLLLNYDETSQSGFAPAVGIIARSHRICPGPGLRRSPTRCLQFFTADLPCGIQSTLALGGPPVRRESGARAKAELQSWGTANCVC